MQSADPVDSILTFPRGVNSVFVDILLTDDNFGLENVEVFPLSLERLSITPSSVEFSPFGVTTINILDNDSKFTLVVTNFKGALGLISLYQHLLEKKQQCMWAKLAKPQCKVN